MHTVTSFSCLMCVGTGRIVFAAYKSIPKLWSSCLVQVC
jgi:hypothetical protein